LPYHDSDQSRDRQGALFSCCDDILMSLGPRLERYFEFQALGANWRTEVLAGFTTFMTMAYIQVYFWNAVIE
jgi:hypothetical protein